jgi:hypothetical protein
MPTTAEMKQKKYQAQHSRDPNNGKDTTPSIVETQGTEGMLTIAVPMQTAPRFAYT